MIVLTEPFSLVAEEEPREAQTAWTEGNDAHYVLDGQRRPIVSTWAAFEAMPRAATVVAETVVGSLTITTLFVGFDLADGNEEEPIVFQTIVRTEGDGWDCSDYPTWEKAEAGHLETVAHYQNLTLPLDEGMGA